MDAFLINNVCKDAEDRSVGVGIGDTLEGEGRVIYCVGEGEEGLGWEAGGGGNEGCRAARG